MVGGNASAIGVQSKVRPGMTDREKCHAVLVRIVLALL